MILLFKRPRHYLTKWPNFTLGQMQIRKSSRDWISRGKNLTEGNRQLHLSMVIQVKIRRSVVIIIMSFRFCLWKIISDKTIRKRQMKVIGHLLRASQVCICLTAANKYPWFSAILDLVHHFIYWHSKHTEFCFLYWVL